MSSYKLKPAAIVDLNDIGDYTLGKWGEEQEEAYLASLHKAFSAIAENPYSGPSYDQVRKGYRKYVIGKHVIFYRLVDTGVEVVRILYQGMDISTHLEDI